LIAKATKSSPDKKPGGHRTKRIVAPNGNRTRVSAVKETLRRSPKGLTAFYQRLIANGKTLVAITAVMRKLIVIRNAEIRQPNPQSELMTMLANAAWLDVSR
jgi:hypothetical protein